VQWALVFFDIELLRCLVYILVQNLSCSGLMLIGFFSVIGAFLLFSSLGWASYLFSWRFSRLERVSLRLCVAILSLLWGLIALFYVFASIGLFFRSVVLPVCVALTLIIHRSWGQGARERLTKDLALGREILGAGGQGWVFFAAALISLRSIRGWLRPPLGWDSLTYHYVKPGRWIQAGGFAPELLPDAGRYYEYFPVGGEILWAWTGLVPHNDSLYALAGVAIWLSCALAGYALARRLGASSTSSLYAAALIVLCPSIGRYATSGYVDNMILLAYLLGVVLAGHFCLTGSLRFAIFASGAFGVALSIKPQAAIWILVWTLLFLWRSRREPSSRWWRGLVACGMAVSIGAPHYVATWVSTGSPLYPFSGNEQLANLLANHIPIQQVSSPWWLYLMLPLVPLNPGLSLLLLLILSIDGVASCLQRANVRPIALLLLVTSLVPVMALFSPQAEAFRASVWALQLGRYISPFLVALIVFAAQNESPQAQRILRWLIWFQASLLIPFDWSIADLVCVPLWIIALFALFLRRTALRLLLLVLFLLGALFAQKTLRYSFYQGAAQDQITDPHPLRHGSVLSAIWQSLDREQPLRIAVAAGWDGIGHNWYRAPLLGSQLQNLLFYIPISSDGQVIDYWRPEALSIDVSAWSRRLSEANIEYVVLLPPSPPEAKMIAQHPERFLLELSTPEGGALYRLLPE
jgi:hypothetical protein